MDNFVDDEGGGGSADDEYSDIEDIGSSYQASFGCQGKLSWNSLKVCL